MEREARSDPGGDERIRAAFVNVSSPGSDLWVNSHERARAAVDAKYSWLETHFVGDVKPGESEPVFEDLAERGFDIIFGNVYDYMDSMSAFSEEYPEIVWENATGYRTGRNFAWYQARLYQAMYLAGMTAARLPEVSTLGYVAAFPIPYAYRQINALTTGARSIDPTITTRVKFVDEWCDYDAEYEVAQTLVDGGVDLLTHMPNSTATADTAEDNDVWFFGQYMPQNENAGDRYLTAGVPTWERHYEKEILAVRDRTWQPDPDWGGFAEGYVTLDDWGPEIPKGVKEDVEEAKQRFFIDREASIWDGTSLEGISDGELYGKIDSIVDGVDMEVPTGQGRVKPER